MLVTLDFSKVFDAICQSLVCLFEGAVHLLGLYLSDTLQVDFKYSINAKIHVAVPQGLIFWPLLFVIQTVNIKVSNYLTNVLFALMSMTRS